MKKYIGIGFDHDGINFFLYNRCIRFAWITHFGKNFKFFYYDKDELEKYNMLEVDFFIGLVFNI